MPAGRRTGAGELSHLIKGHVQGRMHLKGADGPQKVRESMGRIGPASRQGSREAQRVKQKHMEETSGEPKERRGRQVGLTSAGFLIGGVAGEASSVARLGGVNTLLLPELPLRPPEAAHTCLGEASVTGEAPFKPTEEHKNGQNAGCHEAA